MLLDRLHEVWLCGGREGDARHDGAYRPRLLGGRDRRLLYDLRHWLP